MGKNILAVVAGYVAIFVFTFITFSLAYLVLGADGSFQTGSYEVTATWLVLSFILGLAGATLGGFICALISKSRGGPLGLAGLVLVLGLVVAAFEVMKSDDELPKVRTGEVGNFEAMQNAKQPTWVALLNPFIGVAGVMLGARLQQKKE